MELSMGLRQWYDKQLIELYYLVLRLLYVLLVHKTSYES